jgi:predicted nucleotidyltransferase
VPDLPPILPVGTAIVALVDVRNATGRAAHPRGTAGLIVKSPADPEHNYRVRFPGGDEVTLARRDMEVLSIYNSPGYAGTDPLTGHDLQKHVFYRCIVGSRAYGLSHDQSDTDRRGIYLPPASMHWSIYGVPEQLENDAAQECYWELEKFLRLALKANPNVLEALHSPLVEQADEMAQELLSARGAFVSKLVYQTFNGYAMSQFKKMEQDLRNKGAVRWKHAMHLLRLVLAGIETLRTGVVPVLVTEHREKLLAIRDGQVPWEEVEAWRRELHEAFEREFERTGLPERPDYERANEILLRARRRMAMLGK